MSRNPCTGDVLRILAWRVISRHFPLDRQALTVLWLGTAIIGHSLENMGGSSISHPQIPDAPLLGIIPQKIGAAVRYEALAD